MPRRPLVLTMVAAVLVLGIAADLSWRLHTRPKYAVAVEGVLLGALREPTEAQKAVDAVLSQIPTEMREHVNLAEKVQVRPLSSTERLDLTSQNAIQGALVNTMPDLVQATAITVNGSEIVIVENENEAEAVKQKILKDYESTVLKNAAAVEQLQFQERIDWRPTVVLREEVRTADEAINILRHGTDRLVTYVVKRGDTGWDIARSYNVSTEDLAKANPDVNLDRLQIDQVLNVTFKEPYVHTQSISKRVVEEGIPFTEEITKDPNLWPWQYQVVKAGTWGTRELTIREYRENGRVVKTEVLENNVIRAPSKQIAKQGTKQIPAMGTGSLVFPVVGTLTSNFGPRWGTYHYGIDIGAPTGTPILAADSGMVVFRDWSGRYGYLIKIDHGGGKMVTLYAHLSRFNVKLGDTVNKGDVIGYVGNTGFSTGPHLHYEVHVDGASVNPLQYYR